MPSQLSSNTNEFNLIVDDSVKYWNNQPQQHDNSIKLNLNSVQRRKKYLCTIYEVEALNKISKAYKAYSFRKSIAYKIEKRKNEKNEKKKMNDLIFKSI